MARPSKKDSKTLIIVRHAHRNKLLGRERDNGLSAKGKLQASRIAEHFRRTHGKEKPYVVTSPKVRCVETVMPLARLARTEVQMSSLLEEQDERRNESRRDLEKRIQKFFRWWKDKAPDLTIACSHGDWIPPCLKQITGAEADLAKGGWAEITLVEGKPRLTWMYQDFESEGRG